MSLIRARHCHNILLARIRWRDSRNHSLPAILRSAGQYYPGRRHDLTVTDELHAVFDVWAVRDNDEDAVFAGAHDAEVIRKQPGAIRKIRRVRDYLSTLQSEGAADSGKRRS
jgi:hypothetical protein